MNNQRLLFGAAWLASLIAAYLFAGGGGLFYPADRAMVEEDFAGVTSSSPEESPALPAGPLSEEEKQQVKERLSQVCLHLNRSGLGTIDRRALGRALAILAALDPRQIPEAIAEVNRTVKDSLQKELLFSQLFIRWAETDTRAALDCAEKNHEALSPYGPYLRISILAVWANRHPEEAWPWLQTNGQEEREGVVRNALTVAFFAGVAARDLDAALQHLGSLDGAMRSAALSSIAKANASDNAARRRLLERVTSFSDEERKVVFTEALEGGWPIDAPEDAMEWLRSRSEKEQQLFYPLAMDAFLYMGSAAGVACILEGTPEDEKPKIYESVALAWGSRTRFLSEWLMKQPQGAELDGARQIYVRQVAPDDPETAMRWAKSIRNEETRTQAVREVNTASQKRDAERAEAVRRARAAFKTETPAGGTP